MEDFTCLYLYGNNGFCRWCLRKVVSHLYLFSIYVIVGAIVYFLSFFALKTIKKQDLELVYEYLLEGFKRITVWMEHLASID